MSLMSVSKPNQLITVEYLVNELINQLVNGGPDKQVIIRAYHIINHLEPLSEYFPIETNSNKALAEVNGDGQSYSIYLINNPLLDTDLKGIVNWEELIFMDYLKVKENSELNLNKLNLINFIYNLVQYFSLLKGQKLTEDSQLTKEWQKIYKNKNLRFNLLLNPRRNNTPHTLTLKLNEKLEQIRIQELKEQLKVKSNNVKYLGRSLSASIQSIINYCNYSTQICTLNLSLLSSFSTRLPLKWIDKEFNNSLRILFIKLQNEVNFDPESLVPILELWSVWARRIGELPAEEANSYSAEASQLIKLIEQHLNSNFEKSQKTVELSLMVIVILTDIFKSKELLNGSEKIISEELKVKDSSLKPLLNNSQYIHPTISTLLKHLPLLKHPQQIIQNYLNLQNYEPKIEGNMNTLASLVFILTSLEKEGIASSKLITKSILDPILDSILAFDYDVNKDSNLISPIFALAGTIQVLTQGHNYPSRSYSKKVKQAVNKLTSLELNNTDELTTLDKSISILISNFKKLQNFEKLGADIKSINLFLFNYLIKYWEQFTFKSNKDNDGQLLIIKEIINTPTFKELGKQSQLMGELMSWPFQLSNYFSLDKPELIKLTQLELSKLAEFSQSLFNSWKLGVSETPSLLDKIRDPSNDSVRKSLKSVLFSYVIIFKSILARPMTSVQVSDEELELMLTSLFNLNFSTIIQIPRTIFKNQEDLLIYLLEQVESRKTRVKPFIEGLLKEVEVDSEPTELNSLNQLEQSKISFTLTCIEQLVKEVDNSLLENIIEKLIKPFASEKFSWSLELYEASHSAALSIIQSSKVECVPKFISWYQSQLFGHFPGQMTGEQFRVAYTILVEGLSNQLDVDMNQVWTLYTQLYAKIENCLSKLNTNPELILESIGYINTYAALLPNTPSSYLNEYLAKLEHLIKFFDKHPSITNNTLTALISLVKRMITENCDLGTKPYLVGWYLNLLNSLNLNKNSSLSSQLQA